MPDAFPLTWPEGWPRTESHMQDNSPFSQTPDSARVTLLNEIRRLVGDWVYRREDVILSTNIKLRQDGEPYAGLRAPEDTGVAVYFNYKDKPMVFACDRWQKLHDNIYAIAKTIEALRGIERWGASDMLERAFTGFMALEHNPSTDVPWWQVLGIEKEADRSEIKMAFRLLVKVSHPDTGGSVEVFQELTAARDEGLRHAG